MSWLELMGQSKLENWLSRQGRLFTDARIRSFYSECCRSFVPGNLTAFMAYHVVVPFHHARRPC
ncbi:hypothetical protein GW17_00014485, partial [Ensete ventricosum]